MTNIPSHFYTACFFLGSETKYFSPFHKKKKTGKGKYFPALGSQESPFICSKYMNNNRRNSTPTSYLHELTWPSDQKNTCEKQIIPNYPASSVFLVQCGETACLCSLLVECRGSYKGRDWKRRTGLEHVQLEVSEQLFPNLVSNPSKALQS